MEEFLQPFEGSFECGPAKGCNVPSSFKSDTPPPYRVGNHPVESHLSDFVDEEVARMLRIGACIPWSQVDSTPGSLPHLILPLGVEPSKPRFIWDGRYLNLWMGDLPFCLETLGKLPGMIPEGAKALSADLKNGYYHVQLHPSSYKYFGFVLRDVVYVYTVLPFGWSPAAYIFQELTDTIVNYVRVSGYPCVGYIDDFFASSAWNSACAMNSARTVSWLLQEVLYRAGYYISTNKSVLDPCDALTFLGMWVDVATRTFTIPDKKLAAFEALRADVAQRDGVPFRLLERLVGKAMSFMVAVPATKLLCRAMYACVTEAKKSGSTHVRLCARTRRDVEAWGFLASSREHEGAGVCGPWLKGTHVGLVMNSSTSVSDGAQWDAASQITALPGAQACTDASGYRWGAFLSIDRDRMAAAQPLEGVEAATLFIHHKEGLAVRNFLRSVRADSAWSKRICGRRVDIGIDSEVLLANLRNGGGSCPLLNDIVKDILDEQVQLKCVLAPFYVNTKVNASDSLTREKALLDMTLESAAWRLVRRFGKRCGGKDFSHDLMASDVDAKRIGGVQLPFFTRYHTPNTWGVNALVQNIAPPMYGYCFPPHVMVGAVLEHVVECGAELVLVVSEQDATWWPKLRALASHSMVVCPVGRVPGWIPGSHGYVKCAPATVDWWAFYIKM